MTFYFIICFLLIVLIIVQDFFYHQKKDCSNLLLKIAIVMLLAIAALRAPDIGMDTKQYIRIFEKVANCSWGDLYVFSKEFNLEIGNVLINKIVSYFTKNGQVITALNSFFMMCFLFIFIMKNSLDKSLSVYLFFTLGLYQSGFNIVSSMTASLLVFSGFSTIQERNFKKFLLYILFACVFFHQSVFLFVILYFLYNVKLSNKLMCIIILVASLSSMIYSSLLPVLIYFIPSKYIIYLSNFENENGIIFAMHLAFYFYLTVIKKISNKKCERKCDENQNLYKWALTLEFVAFIFAFKSSSFTRVAYLFTPALLLYIPNEICSIKLKTNRLFLKYSLIVLIGIQYVFRSFINNIASTIPFKFFF